MAPSLPAHLPYGLVGSIYEKGMGRAFLYAIICPQGKGIMEVAEKPGGRSPGHIYGGGSDDPKAKYMEAELPLVRLQVWIEYSAVAFL